MHVLMMQCRTFHTQVVLVYLEWFWRNSVLKCALQPKIAKNAMKTCFGQAQLARLVHYSKQIKTRFYLMP